MCNSPIKISNPYYRADHGSSLPVGDARLLHDCSSRYIEVPCGKCSECIRARQNDIVQRVQMESRNSYIFFCTLTYDDAHLPWYIEDDGSFRVAYADFHDLQLLFKRMRNDNVTGRPFRYYAVSERGSKRGRPHFHVLFFIPKYKHDIDCVTPYQIEGVLFDYIKTHWATNIGTRKHPIYEPLFTYKRAYRSGQILTNFDLHYVRPSLDDTCQSVAFYVSKYLTKHSKQDRKLRGLLIFKYGIARGLEIYAKVRCRSVQSLSFGLGQLEQRDYIKGLIESFIRVSARLDNEYPCFFSEDGLKTFPLGRYYRTKFFSYDLSLPFYMKSDSPHMDNVKYVAESKDDFDKKVNKQKHHDEIVEKLMSTEDSVALVGELVDNVPYVEFDEDQFLSYEQFIIDYDSGQDFQPDSSFE